MKIEKNVDLKKFTTFKMGGCAANLYTPQTEEELIQLSSELSDAHFLGGGSNLLINERTFENVVNLKEFNSTIDYQGEGVFVAGGSVRLQKLIMTINKEGYGGIEYLYSVPGLVGGAVVMNAGRGKKFNACISDYIVEVKVFHNNKVIWMKKSECDFAYRSSVFKRDEYMILAVKFQFKSVTTDESEMLRKERIDLCKKRQDNSYPNFGTVFCESSKFIMQLFRYLPMGRGNGIEYSRKTANWLINKGGSFDEAVRMINKVVSFHGLFKKKCRTEVVIWE